MSDIPEKEQLEIEKVFSPWDDKTVRDLTDWQTNGRYHPFTCPWRHRQGRLQPLVATRGGWICPVCGFSQNWAYLFMTRARQRAALKLVHSAP